MAACEIVQSVCKLAGERRGFPPFELERRFARLWQKNQPYEDGVRVRSNVAFGFEYESDGGQSGGREPRRNKWPTVVGETITEGSITWTCRELTNDSLIYRIDDVDYEVPTGITLHERPFIDEPGAQQVPMEVSGGTAGEVYDIIAKLQTTAVGASAQLYHLILRVTVE